MATKVLTGTEFGYDAPRLYAISHETYVRKCGENYNPLNRTKYGLGEPRINSITGEVGLVIDETVYVAYLPHMYQLHRDRMVNVIEGDGWTPT